MSVHVYGRPVGLAVALLAFLISGACSKSGPTGSQKKVFLVRGKVLVGGQPAPGAFVLFVPVNEVKGSAEPRPRAYVQADGTFDLETYGAKDGAPAGDYLVSITWSQMADGRDDGEDRLRDRFSNAAKSGLTAKVTEGPNELPTFNLLPK